MGGCTILSGIEGLCRGDGSHVGIWLDDKMEGTMTRRGVTTFCGAAAVLALAAGAERAAAMRGIVDPDAVRAFRGILVGLALCVPFWCGIFFLVWG